MLTCAELFTDYLDSKDLKYQVREVGEGDVVVSLMIDSKMTNCIFSGENGKYVSMYTVFESIPADKTAAILFVCNQLNTTYKWLKFYLDKDNDLMVEDDAILSEENAAAECFELVVRRLQILKDVKPVVMRALYA